MRQPNLTVNYRRSPTLNFRIPKPRFRGLFMTDAEQDLVPRPKDGVKGGMKTPDSGKKPGSRNRVTREIAELA